MFVMILNSIIYLDEGSTKSRTPSLENLCVGFVQSKIYGFVQSKIYVWVFVQIKIYVCFFCPD